eukprot:m.44764 g.44764  ORF g.44764 m.44764 type:complete len:343 (-) comp6569_c0_seq1:299-1327(-)
MAGGAAASAGPSHSAKGQTAAPPTKGSPPLSTKGMLFLALLAIQFGAQPLLYREFSPLSLNKKSIVLAGEVTKFVLSAGMLLASGQARDAFSDWTPTDALKLAGAPALVYTVQNVCIQISYANLDGLTFNLLNQSKILFTAIMLYIMMGKRQSIMQCVGLLGLFAASCILSGGKTVARDNSKADASVAFYEGIVPCLAASLLSGVASALSQIALQSKNRNSLVFTMELAFFSSLSVLAGEFLFGNLSPSVMARGWTLGAMVPVVSNGLGGICVGMVVKYAGGVRKGFSIVGGIVLTGLLQYFFYQMPLTTDLLIALPIVIVSMVLHIMYPYTPSQSDAKKSQ